MSGDDLAAWLRGVGVCLALLLPACAAAPLAGAETPDVASGVPASQAVGSSVAAAADPAGPAPAPGRAPRSKNGPFGLSGFDSDQPLSIHSDELEASQSKGARRLVFSKNVKVEQADLQLESARLEAFYPENVSQPDRLVASGEVHVLQGTREARCDKATYYRTEDLLVCEGHAELRDGEDRVAGAVIEFYLAAERVLVKGGATVLFHPKPEKPQERAVGAASADPAVVAP